MTQLQFEIEHLFKEAKLRCTEVQAYRCFAFGEKATLGQETREYDSVQRIMPTRNYKLFQCVVKNLESNLGKGVIQDSIKKAEITHLRLMSYLLIAETKYMYKVLANCFRV